MSEAKITVPEAWALYRHRENPRIEYEVEAHASGDLVTYVFKGEPCYRVRTFRNILLEGRGFIEERHEPAYTFMPAEGFLDIYERVEG